MRHTERLAIEHHAMSATLAPPPTKAPPGPPPFKGSRRFGSHPHLFMHELLSEYGDFVRYRSFFDVYLVNHPEYVRKVLAQNHEHFSKRTIDYRVLAQAMGNGLVSNDGAHWVKQRKLMQPVFSNRNVNSFDETINEYTSRMLDGWITRGAAEPLWIDREMGRLTFEIVGSTLFGSDIQEHATEIREILEVINIQTQDIRALMTLFSWIPTKYNRKWRAAKARLDRIVYEVMDAREQRSEGVADILDRLIDARDEETGEGMDRVQMRDEVVTLMLAGHETSANALCWTLYLLSRHPQICGRLREELSGALSGAAADSSDLAKVPYLKQVVQESMRVFPPVWAVARCSEQEEVFGEYVLPANKYVGVTPYAIHRHPEFWPDPEQFDPERFDPANHSGRHSYAYLPFAAGPRACIGAGMAMLEIQLVLAQIVQRFDFALVDGHPIEAVPKVTLNPRYGLPMHLTPR
ncbi:MAG: cytochrome P450 [Pseudomonadota bacterium]